MATAIVIVAIVCVHSCIPEESNLYGLEPPTKTFPEESVATPYENSFTIGGVFDLSGGRSTYWNDPDGENNEQWRPGQGTVDIT